MVVTISKFDLERMSHGAKRGNIEMETNAS